MGFATRLRQFIGLCLMVAILLVIAAIGAAAEERAPRTESVMLDGAATATIDVELPAGLLQIAAGSMANTGTPIPADNLLYGDFYVDEAFLAPTVEYRVNGEAGLLELRQDGTHENWPWQDHQNRWNLFLNPEVPTDLSVDVGAGKTLLVLGGLTLTDLDVATGVGETTLDLTGDWRRDLRMRVTGGVGELMVRLPDDVGVRIEANVGAGDLDTDGLRRDGDYYVNDVYGQTERTITIEIDYAAGDITLEVAD